MTIITGDNDNNVLVGTSSADTIQGLDGTDVLIGGGGNDILNGGTGADTMDGGSGGDTYIVDNAGDKVVEYENKGEDTVRSSITFSLNKTQHVENLILTGSADIDGHGNGLDNDIYGNSGDNHLSGGAGDDYLSGGDGDDNLDGGLGVNTLRGGNGDDYYFLSSGVDIANTVIEDAGQGIDTVASTGPYHLGANLENLILIGSADINGYGNELSNTITGNSGNNYLYGGAGADIMQGGDGDDRYGVDNLFDQVTEQSGAGNDTVLIDINGYSLGANLENLLLQGSAHLIGFGNSLDNHLLGNSGNNVLFGHGGNDTLNGGAGIDTMIGGVDDDSYYVDDGADVVTELAGQGNDTVYSTAYNYVLSDAASVEILSLDTAAATGVSITGNSQHQTVFGNVNDNVLNGGGANDILSGLGGNDTFVFHAGEANGDVVYEFEGNGAGTGDVLQFEGYGPGATFTQQTATEWFITSGDGTVQEVITLIGAPTIDASDFVFV
jgi:Ca2+-binding RTX toxin-like protein